MQITLCQVPDRYDWLGKVALKVISAEADIGRAGTNPRPHELQARKIIDPCLLRSGERGAAVGRETL